MSPKLLPTRRLVLRPFDRGDEDEVFAYWSSDPDWEKFNASVPSGFTLEDARLFVTEIIRRDRTTQPSWAIVHSNKVVGIVSLSYEHQHRSAVIGYGIHASLRGRGMVVEATKRVIRNAFEIHRQLGDLKANIDPENRASARVLEKLGFRQTGAEYQLLREDFSL